MSSKILKQGKAASSEYVEQQSDINLNDIKFKRTQSTAEIDGIKIALEEVHSKTVILYDQGMSKYTFFFGVINACLTPYLFGKFPQYFWIFYLIKIPFLLITKYFRNKSRKLQYYMLDFCWVLNFLIFITLLIMTLTDQKFMSNETRSIIVKIIFGFTCGPLGWSVALLGNALVFHSVDHISSLFIHNSGLQMMFTLRWNSDIILQEFPNLYSLGALNGNLFHEIVLSTFSVYCIWWVLYTIWLINQGIYLPQQGYDTIFNYNYKSSHQVVDSIAKLMGQNLPNEVTKLKVVIYMFIHMGMVFIGIWWSLLCWQFEYIHFSFLLIMQMMAIWNGASFYNYFMTQAQEKAIMRILQEKQKKKIN